MSAKWPKVKLGEVLTERREEPSPDALASGRIRIVEKIGFNTGRIQLRSDGKTKTGMILIKPGDLVLSGINVAKGAVAIYDKNNAEPIAATVHYGAYIPNSERVSINFLWWMFRSNFFKNCCWNISLAASKRNLKPNVYCLFQHPCLFCQNNSELWHGSKNWQGRSTRHATSGNGLLRKLSFISVLPYQIFLLAYPPKHHCPLF